MNDYPLTQTNDFIEQTFFDKALSLQKQGQLEKAIDGYQQAIQHYPNYSEAYYNLAVIYQQQGLIEKAIESYEKVIILKPSLICAYNNLGCLWLQIGEYNKAIKILQQALTIKSEDAFIYNNLGKAFLKKGEVDLAISYCLRAITLNPNILEAYDNLGQAFYQQKLYTSAVQSWQKVLQVKPNSVSIHNQCVSALMAQKKYLEATIHLHKIITLEDQFITAYHQWSEKIKNEDYMDQVTQACGQLLKNLQQPSFGFDEFQSYLALIYLYLGHVLEACRHPQSAELYYQKAIAIQPHCIEAYVAWGDILTQQHQFESAISKYQQALKLQPHTTSISSVYQKISNILEKQNKLKSDISLENKRISKPSQNPKNICLGLDCQSCLKRIRKQLKNQVIASGIEQYFPPDQPAFEVKKPTVTIIPHGRVWIDSRSSWWKICNAVAIFNQQQEFIPKLSPFYPTPLPGCEKIDSNQNPILKLEELPSLKIIEGRVAVLSGLSGSVYFHWMIDILPKFNILQQSQISLESIDYFLINSRKTKFQKETLDKLGIPADKIIESDQISHLQASDLIVPDYSAYIGWTVPNTIQFLRHLFHPKIQTQKQYPKRIYISRNSARYRRVLNEQEVINFLSKFGFYTFEMESLSVQEQANLFANAETIIAPHGAGLTNLVFCQPQTTVVELVSPHYIRYYYEVISQQLGLNHYTLQAEALGCSFLRNLMYPHPSFEDLWISIESLERLHKTLNLALSD